MNNTVLGGSAEVAIGVNVIPPELLSEVNVELTGGMRERETLGGTFSRPSGTFETAEVTFTMYLPSMDYLKNIFPDIYNAPTAPQTAGNIIFTTGTCASVSGQKVNIHFTCDTNDANDVYIYNGFVNLNFNPSYTAGDDLTVEISIYANPDENGNVLRVGTGDLTEESYYDPTTQTTKPVNPAP
jgi:hypothetical protein